MNEVFKTAKPLTPTEEGVLTLFVAKALERWDSREPGSLGQIPESDMRQLSAELHLSEDQTKAYDYLARCRLTDSKEVLDWDVWRFDSGDII